MGALLTLDILRPARYLGHNLGAVHIHRSQLRLREAGGADEQAFCC